MSDISAVSDSTGEPTRELAAGGAASAHRELSAPIGTRASALGTLEDPDQLDPSHQADKLREHLSGDHPLALLLGAGASAAAAGIDGKPLVPAVIGLTNDCRDRVTALGAWAASFWEGLTAELAVTLELEQSLVSIEDLLTAIRVKLDALSADDKTLGIARDQLADIERTITETIAEVASPEEERIPDETPQRSLARWIGHISRRQPVEIFTTNYDTLIERGLEAEGLPYFDGFVGGVRPFFMADSMVQKDSAPASNWTRVWKLHGSVNWELGAAPSGARRIVRREKVKNAHLILPSALKYDQSRKLPYIAMLDRLTRSLVESPGTLLVSIGFSFGDQHINDIIRDGLEASPTTHLIALQYKDPEPGDELWKIAADHANVLALGPRRAIIGRRVGVWQLLDSVTDETAGVVDPLFDSDAITDDGDAVTGAFRLGDFNWLGKFLSRIAGPLR